MLLHPPFISAFRLAGKCNECVGHQAGETILYYYFNILIKHNYVTLVVPCLTNALDAAIIY